MFLKSLTIIISIIAIFSNCFAQKNLSPRLSGMGNVSVAVPDPENEMYTNPAKFIISNKMFVRFSPTYLNESFALKNTPSAHSGSPTDTYEEALNEFSSPVDFLMFVDSFMIGASIGKEYNTFSDKTNYTLDNNRSKYNSFSESSVPLTQGMIIGGAHFKNISLGASIKIGKSNGKSSNSYDRTLVNSAPYSYLYESTNEYNFNNYCGGVNVELTENLELSGFANIGFLKSSGTPTRIIENNVALSLSNPEINSDESRSLIFSSQLRYSLNDNLQFGLKLNSYFRTTNRFLKDRWLDKNYPIGIYEDRIISSSDYSSFSLDFGVSTKLKNVGIFSVEFSYEPGTLTSKRLYSIAGINWKGFNYSAGDVERDYIYKTNTYILRFGTELMPFDGIRLRGGAEVTWSDSKTTTNDHYYNETYYLEGEQYGSMYSGFGVTYYCSFFKIDYTLAINPTNRYITEHYSSYNMNGTDTYLLPDILMSHSMALTIEL